MDNQHKKIKGYRDLSQTEIDLMNKVKEKGIELMALVAEVQGYLKQQSGEANAKLVTLTTGEPSEEAQSEVDRLNGAEPLRWAAIAKTDLQTGLMALTRSVAQPGFF